MKQQHQRKQPHCLQGWAENELDASAVGCGTAMPFGSPIFMAILIIPVLDVAQIKCNVVLRLNEPPTGKATAPIRNEINAHATRRRRRRRRRQRAGEFSPSWNLIQSGSDVQLVSFSLVVRRTYVRHASAPSQHVCAAPLVNFKAVVPSTDE